MSFDLSKLTLKEKIGQMIGLAFYGDTYSDELKYQIEDIGAGLVIYFKDNCTSLERIFDLNKELNKHAKIPPFIALDQEGGMVARVTTGITQSPGAMAISATNDVKNAYDAAYNMGKELRMLGFNFNFAPDGDINNNPLNPVINVRSYSDKPEVVSEYVLNSVHGYTDSLMMSSIKHYPGHGDTSVDSHLGLPMVDFDKERLYNMELVPFIMAKEHNLPGIMASHVMFTKFDKDYPTTLSRKVVHDLLREEIGYNGLVVTDSLTMKAVWGRYSIEEICLNGFNSGCDILLLCGARDLKMQKEFADTAYRLACEGKIKLENIDAAVERILHYKEMFKCGEMPNKFSDVKDKFEDKLSMAKANEIALKSITVVKNEHNLLPITKKDKTLVVFPILKVVTLVDNPDNSLNSLGDFFPFEVDKHYISINPTDEEKASLNQKISSYDKIIYCSYNACFNSEQASLINSIDKDKLIVIALRTPYDLNVLDVKNYICSYEASVLSFTALVKILTEDIKATGILPVTLYKK